MKGKLIWSIFWALIVVFIVLIISILATGERWCLSLWGFYIFGAAFFLLGAALIFLTVKEKVGGMSKKFLILTGASAVGLPVFIALHNIFYALLTLWFGEDFWGASGDEPVFFILATMVCPIAFLVGAIGSIVLRVKKSRTEKKLASSPQ